MIKSLVSWHGQGGWTGIWKRRRERVPSPRAEHLLLGNTVIIVGTVL